MTNPTRVVNLRREPYEIYIGRSGRGLKSVWGNPFRDGSKVENIKKFESWIFRQPHLIHTLQSTLRGKVLGCFCHPFPCHGDVLAFLADYPCHIMAVGDRCFLVERGVYGDVVDARILFKRIEYLVRTGSDVQWMDDIHAVALTGSRHDGGK